MTTEKILYTDGHEVIVTDSFFKVKKSSYQLNGITKHRLFIIYPDRLIPFLVLAIGALMVTLGILRMIPNNFMPEVEFYSIQLNANIVGTGPRLASPRIQHKQGPGKGFVMLDFYLDAYHCRPAPGCCRFELQQARAT